MIVERHERHNTSNLGLQLQAKLSLKHLDWYGNCNRFNLGVLKKITHTSAM